MFFRFSKKPTNNGWVVSFSSHQTRNTSFDKISFTAFPSKRMWQSPFQTFLQPVWKIETSILWPHGFEKKHAEKNLGFCDRIDTSIVFNIQWYSIVISYIKRNIIDATWCNMTPSTGSIRFVDLSSGFTTPQLTTPPLEEAPGPKPTRRPNAGGFGLRLHVAHEK